MSFVTSQFVETSRNGLPTGITLYAKIASVLRTQISSGELSLGERLPSIEQLSAHYKVAPITVRHAVRQLIEEGLLSSHRGRGTFVTGTGLTEPQAASNVGVDTPHINVTLLEHAQARALPEALAADFKSLGDYVFIRKLHHDDKRMFFVMDTYVGRPLQAFLPPVIGDGFMMINTFSERLVRRKVEVITRVKVTSADVATANLLRCELTFPIAQIDRIFVDSKQAVLLASKSQYRADFFQLQTKQTAAEFFTSRGASSVHPEGDDARPQRAGNR